MPEPPRLLDRVCAAVRTRHYSCRTEEAYFGWMKRFILVHRKRHPAAMGADEVNAFLAHLAVEGKVSASSRRRSQAFVACGVARRHARESGMRPRRWVDRLRPSQPLRRLIRCEPRSPSRRSILHRACATLGSPDACTVARRRATMRYAAQRMLTLLQTNATER
jgi:hypothetical protein